METFKTKTEAIDALADSDLFALENREGQAFMVQEIIEGDITYKYCVQITKQNKKILESSEAALLSKYFDIHIKESKIYLVTEDHFYNSHNTAQGRLKRYLAEATVVYLDKEYRRTGNAGADNCFSGAYAPEMATKRAEVRAIIAALGLTEVNADIEMPPSFWKEERHFGEKTITSAQLEAIKRLADKEFIAKILEENKAKTLSEIPYEKGAEYILALQKNKLQ